MEKENKQLLKHISNLEKQSLGNLPEELEFQSWKHANPKTGNQKKIRTRAQKALQFVELFGLELECLKMKDPGSSKSLSQWILRAITSVPKQEVIKT